MDGILILASAEANPEALRRAAGIVAEMLANRPDLKQTIAEQNGRVVVVAASEVTTDVPELNNLHGWDVRRPALHRLSSGPLIHIWEPNLLCSDDDVFPNESLLVHEWAHMVMLYGLEKQPEGWTFRSKVSSAYYAALGAGLWQHTYAASNLDEYWAEGVQSWLGLNDLPGPIHNDINGRIEVEEYDPALADLIEDVLGDIAVTASCHEVVESRTEYAVEGRVIGPKGAPISSAIRLLSLRSDIPGWWSARTRSDGSFTLWTQSDLSELRIELLDYCGFIGWWDGKGITTNEAGAIRISVEDGNAAEIIIVLPAPPEEIPCIEYWS